ncbi:hypothetical protein D3C85_1474550 [compost metagenome]
MGGAVDHGQALAGGLIGFPCGLRGLGGAAGNVLCGRTHLVGGGGHLVDLAVLLLHAGTGLGGDGR